MNSLENQNIDANFAFSNILLTNQTEIRNKSAKLDQMDELFILFQPALDWAANHPDQDIQVPFLDTILNLEYYLQARSLHSITLRYASVCLNTAAQYPRKLMKLLLMICQAQFMDGQWEEAGKTVARAVDLAKKFSYPELSQAYLLMGVILLNRGNYQPALKCFEKAKSIYQQQNDENGYCSVISQEAAYYIDHDQYLKANDLYEMVEHYEYFQFMRVSSHTLLMMGVTSRRLKQYIKAEAYLSELLQRGIENHSTSDQAAALHHLGWVYLNKGELNKAWNTGIAAKRCFRKINDPRGISDADKQLGDISLARRDYKNSEVFLKQAIAVRKELHNNVGLASASRRLAKAYFGQKRWIPGSITLAFSALTYFRLGMLNSKRLKRWLGKE
jgi:tetratricopeptide (TPR) repeat protein